MNPPSNRDKEGINDQNPSLEMGKIKLQQQNEKHFAHQKSTNPTSDVVQTSQKAAHLKNDPIQTIRRSSYPKIVSSATRQKVSILNSNEYSKNDGKTLFVPERKESFSTKLGNVKTGTYVSDQDNKNLISYRSFQNGDVFEKESDRNDKDHLKKNQHLESFGVHGSQEKEVCWKEVATAVDAFCFRFFSLLLNTHY